MKRFFDEGADLGTGSSNSKETTTIIKNESTGPALTPELVEMMETKIKQGVASGLESGFEEKKAAWEKEYREKIKTESLAKKKEEILAKIKDDESLKKHFETYGIDYNTIDNDNLERYMNIFQAKANQNTAGPKGAPSTGQTTTVKDADKFLEDFFKKKMGGK